MPPRHMISECIALYFQYCHKQPLWLFDPESFSNPADMPDEVILGISCLALRYSRNRILDGQVDQLCRQYAEAAHSLISFRISRGTVKLSTMQALCLIALAEYIGQSPGSESKEDSLLILAQLMIPIWRGCTSASSQILQSVGISTLNCTRDNQHLLWKLAEGCFGVSIFSTSNLVRGA